MLKKTYNLNVPTIIVSAIVAIAVSAPLSNAANDQVRVVVKKITGKQGKRGPRGLRGPTGATGPAGRDGRDLSKPGLYDPKQILPGETVTVLAGGCGAMYGSVVGGVVESDGPASITAMTILDDGPGNGGSYYYAVVHNPTSTHAVIRATADCAN